MQISRRTVTSWVLSGLCLAAIARLVQLFAQSSIQWGEVLHYMTVPQILHGMQVTVLLTIATMVLGILIGIGFALMRVSEAPVLVWTSSAYIWLFRGIPLLVQIIFWFNLAIFVPRLGVGPLSVPTNSVMTTFVAATIALSLHESAYMAEIIRGGIQAVDKGQVEAARALGISRQRTFRRIVLPQALRVVIPATGNQAIGMLKATSLVSVIGVHDLLTQAQMIYTKTYLIMELLITASIWYLVLTAILSGLQQLLEQWVFTRRARKAAQREDAFSRAEDAASLPASET